MQGEGAPNPGAGMDEGGAAEAARGEEGRGAVQCRAQVMKLQATELRAVEGGWHYRRVSGPGKCPSGRDTH